MSPTARTLRLLALLQRRRWWAGAELAGALGVSERTLRRDVERLREIGYPVATRRGVAGGYGIAPGATLPPLLIDDEEAVAVALGLRLAAHGAVAGLEGPSLRALAKVSRVLPPRLRGRVGALGASTTPATWSMGPQVDAESLVVVAEACRDAERVRFAYTARDGAETDREVEPREIVALGRRLYLVAWDTGRRAWRSFRLDRLREPCATGVGFTPRRLPASDAAAFVRSSVEGMPRTHAVEVLVEATAAEVESAIGRWATAEAAGERRALVRMSTDALEWPAMALGMVGAPFSVRSPPELRALLADWGRRFVRAGGADGPA